MQQQLMSEEDDLKHDDIQKRITTSEFARPYQYCLLQSFLPFAFFFYHMTFI